MKIKWKLSSFDQLSVNELYSILRLRQQVFIVEQQCIYQDCDSLDPEAYHLMGYPEKDQGTRPMAPVAYLRLFLSEGENHSSRVGRLLIHRDFRNKGLAREIMNRCLHHIRQVAPQQPVYISAQEYLIKFYQSLNFHLASDVYDEDGIPHVEMIRFPEESF